MTDRIVTRHTKTHAHTYGPTNIIRLHYISVAKAASDYHLPTQANILTLSLSTSLPLSLSLLPHSSTHSDLYPRAISIKFCSSLGEVNPKSSQMSQTQTTAMSRPGIMPCPTHTHTHMHCENYPSHGKGEREVPLSLLLLDLAKAMAFQNFRIYVNLTFLKYT